ncbi:Pickpocket protein 11 [Gryllus bimaculatus]|nr:Pickpocket protein 11 [Gryllus bimaculatus]
MPADACVSKADHENSRWKKYQNQIWNFFNNTSVHGVKYLAEITRPYPERILWLLSIVLSIIVCGYLISKSWDVRSSSPVILAMDKKQRAVWDIPFPAITICPTDRMRPTIGLTKHKTNAIHCAMNLICDKKFPVEEFHRSEKYLDYKEIVNWHIEKGYTSKNSPNYPKPALGSGGEAGMLILLKNEAAFSISKACTFVHGFEVQVHNPVDFPGGGQKYYAPLNSMVQVFVTPEEVITDDLRSYTPEQRQCYYSDERKLKFFNVYSQTNCELECLSEESLKSCNCVEYYLPRHKDTPVCLKKKQIRCSGLVKEEIASASGMTREDVHRPESGINCKCLPSCSHVRYRYHAVHTPMERKQLEEIYREMHEVTDYEDCDFTIIQVLFTESLFIPFRRLELYGTVEFLANCGGVLGLCLGVSVLSIIEILYWLLVRPFFRAPPNRSEPKEAESANLTAL